jgi:hypothetical protein
MTDERMLDDLIDAIAHDRAGGGAPPALRQRILDARTIELAGAGRTRRRDVGRVLLIAATIAVAGGVFIVAGSRPTQPAPSPAPPVASQAVPLAVEAGPTMAKPVYLPQLVATPDGGVLVAGTGPGQFVHAESLASGAGSFTTVWDPGGLVASGVAMASLRDGSAVLVVPPTDSQFGPKGDGAVVRFQGATKIVGPVDPAIGWRAKAVLNSTPTQGDDGRVTWTPLCPWCGSPSIVYDPATNGLSLKTTTPAVVLSSGPTDFPINDAIPIEGGRWLIGTTASATIYDPATGQFHPLQLPTGTPGNPSTTVLQHAAPLADGRIFLTGSDNGVWDPLDGSFVRSPQVAIMSYRLTLRDGRVLLAVSAADPLGPNQPIGLSLFNPADDSYQPVGGGPVPPSTTFVQRSDGSIFGVTGLPDDGTAGQGGATWLIH